MAADSSERFVLLNQLGEEFAERFRRGERPALQEYIDRHPELADEIREFFPEMVELEQVKEDRKEATEPPTSCSLPPLGRLGDFRILREIGRGGMGVVFEAEQVSLGRHVALKVLAQRLLVDARTRRRFEREAKSAARLHHTNIVPIFGVGEQDGMPYYVMQFIHGLGLDAVLEELKKLQFDHAKAGAPAHGELRVATNERKAPSLPGESTGLKTPTEGAGSAMNVARSLLTGALPSPLKPYDEDTSPVSLDGERTEDPGADTPRSPVLSDASSLSGSSVVLPGGSRDGSKSKNRKRTYWQSVASIAAQVADALEYAHRQGIHHRDVKPSNLLLDKRGTVWVTDFGLAKADDQQNLTHTGDILGTLRYMPPEAFEGKTDARSDVYSLGLTLYELLAFRPAFDERERNQLIRQVTTEEPPRLDRLNPRVPRDLVTIVNKAIERDPQRRYATAGGLAADLQRFLEDEPILARRQTQAERCLALGAAQPGRGRPGGVLTGLLVVVTIVSLLAAGYFDRLRQNERTARREAEQAADEARHRGEAERWERYRSDITTAGGALQLQNSGTARIALDAAPPEHRNWEWQHFHSQLDGARLVLPLPTKAEASALCPSGRQVAVSSEKDNQIYLCDVATGKVETILRGHSARVSYLEYRPDGKQLASGGDDHRIQLWDPSNGRECAVLNGKGLVVYSPDGCRFASLEHNTRRLWDSSTGKEIAVLEAQQEEIQDWNVQNQVAFSPDGRHVAVASKSYVRLSDATTGRLLAALGPCKGLVHKLAYSPDGKRIASTMYRIPTMHLWDAATGKEVAALHGHTSDVTHLQFSPDGLRLVSSSDDPDNSARLWDAVTGRLLKVMTGHRNCRALCRIQPGRSADRDGLPGSHGEALGRQVGRADRRARRSHRHCAACRIQPERRARRHRFARCHASALGRPDGRLDQRVARTQRLVEPAGLHSRQLRACVRLRRHCAHLGPTPGGTQRDSPRARELRLRRGLQP